VRFLVQNHQTLSALSKFYDNIVKIICGQKKIFLVNGISYVKDLNLQSSSIIARLWIINGGMRYRSG
jgi:hypothetical protein